VRVLLIVLALALVRADAWAQPRTDAHVSGRVLDAATQQPLSGSLVWLAGRTMHMARTADDGSYAFGALAPGAYCIRIDTPGYEPARACISVSAGARMSVDLPLTLRPVVMAPLVVQGRRGAGERGAATAAADSALITPLDQQLALLGAQSSHRAAAALGGLTQNASTDRSGGRRPHALYMWGSSAERGRVLLDGASLNAPLHLGALLPPVDPQVIESAAVHTAGVSPRYDGGTAYIMDFTTRAASDRQRTWGELDLLAARVGAETPINGRGRVLVSARRVNDEIIGRMAPSRFGYGYRDALARADLALGTLGSVHATAFATGEAVDIPRDLGQDRAAWENRAATLAWHASGDATTAVTLSASRGVADLPLLSALGGHLEATLDRYSVQGRTQRRTGAVEWELGGELEHHEFRRRASATHDPETGEPGSVSCTDALPCARAGTTLAAAFTELLFSPARDLAFSVGARAMYDGGTRSMHVLPRAALTYLPDARHSLTLSAGRFSQPYVGGTADSTATAVRIAHAAHVELQLARRTDRVLLRGSAYLRRHERVEPTRAALTVPGADLSLEYALPAGTLGLAWSVSGAYDAAEQDLPVQHLASAGFHARRGRVSFSTTAAYGAGLPITSIVLDEPADADELQPGIHMPTPTTGAAQSREPDYLRLDSWLGAEWRVNRGERAFTILPYVRIINALGERESLFYFQDSDDLTRPPRALARVPAVPVIGVRWHF
jgi:hypothetical protein